MNRAGGRPDAGPLKSSAIVAKAPPPRHPSQRAIGES